MFRIVGGRYGWSRWDVQGRWGDVTGSSQPVAAISGHCAVCRFGGLVFARKFCSYSRFELTVRA